ncbi:hypothetical protein [Chromobacterium sinusclupearum]|uniref:hypothetical protein n=1 Tax=Chromobacterium sinusclupearum TaxID=2077146 RepID=UPI0011AEEC8E|nr:hypothetical protein [Chromobacterium sinusclupearum]
MFRIVVGVACMLMLAGESQGGVARWYAESSAPVRQACASVASCREAHALPGAARREASAIVEDNMTQLAAANEVMSRSENMRDAKRWFALDLLLLGVGVLCLLGYCRRLLGPEEDEMC